MIQNEKREYTAEEKAWAFQKLSEELEKGLLSVKMDSDWLTLDEVRQQLGCRSEEE